MMISYTANYIYFATKNVLSATKKTGNNVKLICIYLVYYFRKKNTHKYLMIVVGNFTTSPNFAGQ